MCILRNIGISIFLFNEVSKQSNEKTGAYIKTIFLLSCNSLKYWNLKALRCEHLTNHSSWLHVYNTNYEYDSHRWFAFEILKTPNLERGGGNTEPVWNAEKTKQRLQRRERQGSNIGTKKLQSVLGWEIHPNYAKHVININNIKNN